MGVVRSNINKYACGPGTIQSDMPPGPLKIKEKNYLAHASPSDMQTNTVKLYQARLLHCQYNIHAWWSSATPCVAATAAYIYLHAGLVSLTSTAAV